jgi:hypothetical protein
MGGKERNQLRLVGALSMVLQLLLALPLSAIILCGWFPTPRKRMSQ